MRTVVYGWRSEDNLKQLVFFYHWGPKLALRSARIQSRVTGPVVAHGLRSRCCGLVRLKMLVARGRQWLHPVSQASRKPRALARHPSELWVLTKETGNKGRARRRPDPRILLLLL